MAEGFSCSLGVLYRGLRISKLQFLTKKIKIKFPALNFFSILGHQTLDPDPGSGSAIIKNAGSGSALNQCGSATLLEVQKITSPADQIRNTSWNTAFHFGYSLFFWCESVFGLSTYWHNSKVDTKN